VADAAAPVPGRPFPGEPVSTRSPLRLLLERVARTARRGAWTLAPGP